MDFVIGEMTLEDISVKIFEDGLLTGSAPEFSLFGIIYFFILDFIGWFSTSFLSFISKSRKYEISDIEYDKDIK